MIVCITEKPSVARDIAAIIGANDKRDGYYEGNGYCVTWTFGHLCCLKEPHDYTDAWRRWSLSSLPMIPPVFGIKVIDQDSVKRQFHVIEVLTSKADEVINCGDAGQEGELIQRWVMQKAGVKCPVKRLWISSLTDDAIRDGFAALKPQAEFDNLYFAGLSRAVGDWILGMNCTRLFSLRYSSPGNVLSIGRVQTPTLALIVARHFEIAGFKPEDYWELKTVYRGVTFMAASGKFSKQEDAAGILDKITGRPFSIIDVKDKKGKESPPRLFDLTSLQVECNRKWGWTAEETLGRIQSLYEKKVTTYPRVDTTYLSEDLYAKVPAILKNMTPYAGLTASVLASRLPKSKKVFDNSKVTDHHAIIPTGQSPSVLVGDERKLYHLIALRFIAVFYPDCVFSTTTVNGAVEEVKFKASGKVIIEPGWRTVFASPDDQESAKEDQQVMPSFSAGESGSHEPGLQKKTTQPPKPYTEGTLLRAMESAGKTVEDEELREAMKENGIGRPSTRAAIIETLFKRRYIYRQRKNICASQAGIDLIATIHEDIIKSARLTGLWENKLRRIERGQYSAKEFVDELKQLVTQIVMNVLSDNSRTRIEVGAAAPVKSDPDPEAKPKRKRAPAVRSLENIKCPLCGKGHILKGRTAYGCSEYAAGCTLKLPFEEYPADLTPARLASRLKKL